MPSERRRTRPTPAGSVLLALAVLLYFAGSNIGSGWVVLVAATVAGAVAVDLWAARRRGRATTLTATIGTTLQGSEVALEIRADGGLGSTRVAVPAAGGRAVLRGPGPDRFSWALRLGPGHLGILDVTGAAIGPLTLAATRWTTSVEVSTVVPVPVLPVRTRLATVSAAGTTTDGRDPGREIVRGLRERAPGDAARSVHWRATARHGRLLVRDGSAPTGPEVRVVIADGAWTPPAMALAVTIAASLGAAGEAAGQPVRIEVGGTVIPWSPAARFELATTPPLRGAGPGATAPARAANAETRGTVTVRLTPSPEGTLATDPTGTTLLRDQAEALQWL